MVEEVDRLSGLPDGVIHHIFSFLDIGSIPRTAFLAKKWRYFFLETPVRNFILNDWMGYGGRPEYKSEVYIAKFSRFLDLIDKVVLEDSRNVCINKFNLDIDYNPKSLHSSRVISWLLGALNRNANYIRLKFTVHESFELPHQMFTPTSNLQVLILDSTHYKSGARVRMPNSLCTAPRIKRLHLDEVVLPHGDMNGELVLTCPLLEDLKLERCGIDNNLIIFTISTPRLEKMELINVSAHGETSCKVKTYTPNLQELIIRACRKPTKAFIVDYFMEDLSSLVSAKVKVYTEDQEDDVCTKRWSTSLIGILSKAHNMQSLKLSYSYAHILTSIAELLQKLPNLFHKLKHVTLDDPCKVPLRVLLKIMTGIPHLETLTWWSCSFSECALWEDELSFDCIFHHLKSIKIKDFCGPANDFKFLELLLKKAPVLEKVDFTSTWKTSDEDLVELKNKLKALPRVSLTVVIHGSL